MRGLKQTISAIAQKYNEVASHVDAWIETKYQNIEWRHRRVASHVDAWIETLRGWMYIIRYTSHPTWMRGLKRINNVKRKYGVESHPTWMRGLKLILNKRTRLLLSRIPRGCVDWNKTEIELALELGSRIPRGCVDWNFRIAAFQIIANVASHVDAWIETFYRCPP